MNANSITNIRWLSVLGSYTIKGSSIIFKGGEQTSEEGQPRVEIGNFVSNQYFGGGKIGAKFEFRGTASPTAAGLILHYQPTSQAFVLVQIGGTSLCSLRTWSGQEWQHHASLGSMDQLNPNQTYLLEVHVTGSWVSISIDGVKILDAALPFPLPHGQAGVWAMGRQDVSISDFSVSPQSPKLFVIMQFTSPYNQMYSDVIAPVGKSAGFVVIRGDEAYGPGLIISDIEREIQEAKAVVADITPINANVYWEVGYAYAVRKPTILLAERDTKLPFDVSPFRTLFYENTIAGKAKIEEGLKKHLDAIQSQWPSG